VLRILIVDDEVCEQRRIAAALDVGFPGVVCEFANGADEALGLLARWAFDAVTVDSCEWTGDWYVRIDSAVVHAAQRCPSTAVVGFSQGRPPQFGEHGSYPFVPKSEGPPALMGMLRGELVLSWLTSLHGARTHFAGLCHLYWGLWGHADFEAAGVEARELGRAVGLLREFGAPGVVPDLETAALAGLLRDRDVPLALAFCADTGPASPSAVRELLGDTDEAEQRAWQMSRSGILIEEPNALLTAAPTALDLMATLGVPRLRTAGKGWKGEG
jgi:hypothetical protein